MDLNKLRDEAFEIAKAHGWHDEELPDETYLMLIITEIAEAVQADRKDKHADAGLFKADVETLDMADGYDRDVWKRDFEIYIKNTVEDELADVVIRCLDLAGLKKIDFRYADILLSEGAREVQVPFPKLMYMACEEITYHGYDLTERLNDIVAGIIAYYNKKDIDIEWFITQKMKYNKLRPYKHGNKKY